MYLWVYDIEYLVVLFFYILNIIKVWLTVIPRTVAFSSFKPAALNVHNLKSFFDVATVFDSEFIVLTIYRLV